MNEFKAGSLFGEKALLDEKKSLRTLSAKARTNSILIVISKELFNTIILGKFLGLRSVILEEMKIKKVKMAEYVLDKVPKLNEHFSLDGLLKKVHDSFIEITLDKGNVILKEGEVGKK